MAQTEDNERNRLILIALADVFDVQDFDDAFKAASKLKAEVDGGIYQIVDEENLFERM